MDSQGPDLVSCPSTVLTITPASPGSKTVVGGYDEDDAPDSGSQFPVTDRRHPEEVADQLMAMGYDPVWKDWDPILKAGAPRD